MFDTHICGEGCDHTRMEYSLRFLDKKQEKVYKEYLKIVLEKYNEQIDLFVDELKQLVRVAKSSGKITDSSVGIFTDLLKGKVYRLFGSTFPIKFRVEASILIKAYYNSVYDSQVYNETVNELISAYVANLDTFYFGQAVGSTEVANKLLAYISEHYINSGENTSWGQVNFDAMLQVIPELMGLETWKLARIVSTSVARIKNFALLSAMDNAGVTQFQVVSANDLLTCKYCQNLDGKIFSVATAFNNLNNLMSSDSNDIADFFPFITSLFQNPAQMQNLTSEQIQQSGFNIVPAHPNCRCIIVAVI